VGPHPNKLGLKSTKDKFMKNFPDSASQAEISSWKRWAEKAPAPAKVSELAPGLAQAAWESIPGPLPSPYKSCGSCRRIR